MKYANARRRVIEKAPGSHLLTWNTFSKELSKAASPSGRRPMRQTVEGRDEKYLMKSR